MITTVAAFIVGFAVGFFTMAPLATSGRASEIEERFEAKTPDDYVDWSKVPEGYDWVAQDYWDEGTDILRAYKTQPCPSPDWRSTPQDWFSFRNENAVAIPWRESLRHRPEATI